MKLHVIKRSLKRFSYLVRTFLGVIISLFLTLIFSVNVFANCYAVWWDGAWCDTKIEAIEACNNVVQSPDICVAISFPYVYEVALADPKTWNPYYNNALYVWYYYHSCNLDIISLTGSNTIIDPDAGGSVIINGSISDDPGKSITWTLSYPCGSKTGSGSSSSVTWDGKINGKYAGPGTYTATLSAQDSDGCHDSKSVNITVQRTKDCKLQITVGSSANAASGNLSHTQELFSTKGTGLGTNMTLYYNSFDPYSGLLGSGWTHNYDVAVTENSDGSVVLREGNGGRKLYTKSGTSYISQPGDYSTLAKNADGTFIITQENGTKYNFGPNGKIATIVDRNGNAMTFSYTTGNLTTITDPTGRISTLTYDSSNHLSSITNPGGNIYSFTVSNNMLTSVAYPGNGTWSYTYDANAFMLTKTDPNGNLTTYAYDDQQRVASSVAADGSTKLMSYPTGTDTTKTTTFTETDGGQWQYTYDTQAGLLTSKTDPNGNSTSYTYDTSRNMLSKTNPDGSITNYSYDTQGNFIKITDALGQATSYTYNAFGQVTSITDPQGGITAYTYDTTGNVLSTTDATGATTRYQYDSKGNVTNITNAKGQMTSYAYDQYNNLVSITDSAGAVTKFTYDASGNITSQTDAKGNTTTFQYNSQNQLTKVIDPDGNATSYTYDKNGNKTSMTDANGNTTSYEYNYNGQLIQVKDALGSITSYAYGSTGDIGCPSCGSGVDKLTVVMDAKGNTTTYDYDQEGRLIKDTDPLKNVITYSYDAKGNLTSKTDANGNTITYSYDGLGRLLKKTYPDTTTQSFTYDAKGNIITAANKNISYTFTYDAGGRVMNITDSNNRPVSYQYNALGNRTQLTYPDGSKLTYNYDNANRLSSIVNGDAKTFAFLYDSLGRRTTLTYPNGAKAAYAYDPAGRLTSLTHKTSNGAVIDSFSYTLDKVGNRLTKTDRDTQYTYGYDAIYRLLRSLPARFNRIDNGREAEHAEDNGRDSNHNEEVFTYDWVGNRLTGPTGRVIYAYNWDNQLTEKGMQERRNETKKSQYSYDKNGNLIKKTAPGNDDRAETWTYGYDYENRLVNAVKEEDNGTTVISFEYDPFGRRIEKKVLEVEDGKSETRIYDYVYDSDNIILEYVTKTRDGETRTETTRYIQGPGADEHLAIEKTHESYYYHADGLGSITALTDKRQRVVEGYSYSSFGQLKRHGDRVKNTFTYTGREWDKEMGLYYYRARYYDAKIGRFTSFDSILHAANELLPSSNPNVSTLSDLLDTPQSLNPFSYTQNNPSSFVDPSGNVTCTYSILSKTLMCIPQNQNTVISGYAISGDNNLLDQNVANIGPIPLGYWNIDNPGTGIRANLSPIAVYSTYGRSGFQIHGWGSSRGCIAIYLNSVRDDLMAALRCDNGGILEVTP